ncbi:VOC family protein [Candidatus Parcubacteria bacterium]|nr:MAG: VOC family protein [Candidatus Parcubacteria bacterium]
MNRVVHFEIHAENPERAIKFYKAVFGWEFPKWMEESPYWAVMTAPKDSKEPGINGGLLPRKGPSPKGGECVTSYVCTVQVDSIDETIKKIEAAGGALALPKFPIPGMAWQAYYRDTEGNIFGVHQPDTNAK